MTHELCRNLSSAALNPACVHLNLTVAWYLMPPSIRQTPTGRSNTISRSLMSCFMEWLTIVFHYICFVIMCQQWRVSPQSCEMSKVLQRFWGKTRVVFQFSPITRNRNIKYEREKREREKKGGTVLVCSWIHYFLASLVCTKDIHFSHHLNVFSLFIDI